LLSDFIQQFNPFFIFNPFSFIFSSFFSFLFHFHRVFSFARLFLSFFAALVFSEEKGQSILSINVFDTISFLSL